MDQPSRLSGPVLDARGVILDLDGVLYRGDEAMPGARELLRGLHERGVSTVALTNHAARNPQQVSRKLARLGVALPAGDIITSALVAAHYCRHNVGERTSFALLGSPALHTAFASAGLRTVPLGEAADVLVAGYSRELSISQLNGAVHTLLLGARLLGTNPDRLIPDGDRLIPETGPLLSYLQHASGAEALVLGKPQPLAFELALEQLGLPAHEVVMVGDTLQTDVAGAAAAGIRCIWLNETGLPPGPEAAPTRVAANLQQVLALLS